MAIDLSLPAGARGVQIRTSRILQCNDPPIGGLTNGHGDRRGAMRDASVTSGSAFSQR